MMRRALVMSASAMRSRAPMTSLSSLSSSSSSSSVTFVMPRRAYAAQDFVDNTRTAAGHLPAVGRAWKTPELRLKSFDDLHTLWFVLLKEKNMLLSERERCRHNSTRLARPDRLVKVRLSMARIMAVLDERKKVQLKLQEFQKDNLLSAAAADTAAEEPTTTTSQTTA